MDLFDLWLMPINSLVNANAIQQPQKHFINHSKLQLPEVFQSTLGLLLMVTDARSASANDNVPAGVETRDDLTGAESAQFGGFGGYGGYGRDYGRYGRPYGGGYGGGGYGGGGGGYGGGIGYGRNPYVGTGFGGLGFLGR
ncbi:uncharacterized protein LOC128736223 [Sabethes cyaneus]|uniref:uncharacterized protein LOC128736223 n=1 Tax=Sabethes cyaneus TaxID=53552 RepID=UPI00237E4348|nr:uncharacterized protein LOC128736223 [Sabethes cyaneus]